MLASLPNVLLMLCVAWVSRLLSKMLVHETKLRPDFVHFVACNRVFDIVVCSIVNNLLINLLLIVIFLVVVLIIVTAIIDDFFMLTVQSWSSLVMPISVEAFMSLSRALVSISVRVE